MALFKFFLISSLLLVPSAYAVGSKTYIGIFDATVVETGELNVMLRQIEVSSTGIVRTSAIKEFPLLRLEGTDKPIEFLANSSINLTEQLQKQQSVGFLRVICVTCSDEVPSEIATKYEITNIFKIKQSIADIKKSIKDFKGGLDATLALQERQKLDAKAKAAAAKKEAERLRIAFLERHHRKCISFGFKQNTEGYAQCRLKLELAEQQSERETAFAEADERRRQEALKEQAAQLKRDQQDRRRQYEAQIAEQKRQREVAAGLALMQMGSGMYSQPPAAPKPANPINQTIVTPGGKIVNCHTTGSVTNCF